MEQYDIIVLGTGLKKCILSGLLSQSGKRFFTLTGILTMEERVHHFLPFKSFTGSLRFLVLISQWAVEKSGTSTSSPNSFLPTVKSGVNYLMGMFDKRILRKLLLFALNFDKRNPRSYQDVDPNKMTTRDLFCRFDLGLDVMEFTAHAIALHNSESWTSRVGKPSDGSGSTLSLCPTTTPAHTSTPCTAWQNYRRDFPD
ncbi:hypothetical protein CgunFtcFv8_014420 [Champsocephalus gunnari]|uniref:Uncharacterized protein n=1 Tax=Champsocephalus gunnari TaxID=52237 RepID=A0AAN8HZX9_CHAGU|nr:hypothetical protein CgunFtcFv8_014420 [Champsocephalus gunnari]